MHNMNDLSTPNKAFFKRVEKIVRMANRKGMLLRLPERMLIFDLSRMARTRTSLLV